MCICIVKGVKGSNRRRRLAVRLSMKERLKEHLLVV